jgi:hypothetical protein
MTDTFKPTALQPFEEETIARLAVAYSGVERVLREELLPGRYLSKAMTDLESSAMFANKGITHTAP